MARRHQPRARERDEQGMTLPELIISIVILGVIMVPLMAALMAFLKQGTDSVPVYESNIDARMLSTYLRRDVTASESIDGTSQCGTGGSVVVSVRWSDDLNSNLSSYVVTTDGSGQRRLERRLCQGGSVLVTTVVVSDLGANTPTYSCIPDCGAPDSLTMNVRDGNDYRYTVTVDRRVQTT